MKKNNQETILLEKNTLKNKDQELNKIKTTNVNILLNRVRLDQKKSFRKRLFFSILLITLMSSIFTYFVIY